MSRVDGYDWFLEYISNLVDQRYDRESVRNEQEKIYCCFFTHEGIHEKQAFVVRYKAHRLQLGACRYCQVRPRGVTFPL